MKYSLEEINLMCIYETDSRAGMIAELEAALEYVDDPEMLRLIDQTIDKLNRTTDAEFEDLALFPAWEDGGDEDAFSV